METHGLRRWERLRLRRDFDRVFSRGRSVSESFLRVVYLENGLGFSRMAVIVKKKVGKAHVRNRLKRLVREAYRRNKGIFPDSFDMVFVFRSEVSEKAKELSYWEVEEVLRKLAERMK